MNRFRTKTSLAAAVIVVSVLGILLILLRTCTAQSPPANTAAPADAANTPAQTLCHINTGSKIPGCFGGIYENL